jgi:hypothetical protein
MQAFMIFALVTQAGRQNNTFAPAVYKNIIFHSQIFFYRELFLLTILQRNGYTMTDRQKDRQTDRQTDKWHILNALNTSKPLTSAIVSIGPN